MLGDRCFFLILPAVLAPAFIVTGLFFHQQTPIAGEGWTRAWLAACFVGFAAALPFLAMFGITSGLIGPVLGALWAELYGVRHLGGIRAMVTALMLLSTAASPATMGWLFDAGASTDAIAWLCPGYVAIATLLVLRAFRVPRQRRQQAVPKASPGRGSRSSI